MIPNHLREKARAGAGCAGLLLVCVVAIFAIGGIVKVLEYGFTEAGKAIDPYVAVVADRLKEWTKPLWQPRDPGEQFRRQLEDWNKKLEEANRLTDEYWKREHERRRRQGLE